jgi:hypothetical protein
MLRRSRILEERTYCVQKSRSRDQGRCHTAMLLVRRCSLHSYTYRKSEELVSTLIQHPATQNINMVKCTETYSDRTPSLEVCSCVCTGGVESTRQEITTGPRTSPKVGKTAIQPQPAHQTSRSATSGIKRAGRKGRDRLKLHGRGTKEYE